MLIELAINSFDMCTFNVFNSVQCTFDPFDMTINILNLIYYCVFLLLVSTPLTYIAFNQLQMINISFDSLDIE